MTTSPNELGKACLELATSLGTRKSKTYKYLMRFYEFHIKPIKSLKPLTPDQARIQQLKQTVDRSKLRLSKEKELQKAKRERDKALKSISRYPAKPL